MTEDEIDRIVREARYQRLAEQPKYDRTEAESWGPFVEYVELGDDRFAERVVRRFANGYLVRYDRVHWHDQFGGLSDYRFGRKWIEYWGVPDACDQEEFEAAWSEAAQSPPYALRWPSPKKPAPWIAAFQAGTLGGKSPTEESS